MILTKTNPLSLIIILTAASAKHVASATCVFPKELAIEFVERWLNSPKLYVGIVVPNMDPLYSNDIIRFTRKLRSRMKNDAYIRITKNLTKYAFTQHIQNELIWYPYDAGKYDVDQLNGILDDRFHKKHFLLTTKNPNNGYQLLARSKIKFDSNIVIYYIDMKPNNKAVMKFEEIYKVKENQNQLEKNILAEFPCTSKESTLYGLKTYVWKRRNTLKGRKFSAVSYPVKSPVAKVEFEFYYEIMKQLMATINFTVEITYLDESYNGIARAIGEGEYDLGCMGLTFDAYRFGLGDFSQGISSISFALFYVNNEESILSFSVFLSPFRANAWLSLVGYVLILISGFVAISTMIEDTSRGRKWNQIFCLSLKGCNYILRALMTKGNVLSQFFILQG